MKTKSILIAVGVVLVFLIVRMMLPQTAPVTEVETAKPESSSPKNEISPPQKRADQTKALQGPREVPIVDEKAPQSSPECKDLWRDLLKTDLSDKARLSGGGEAMPDPSRCKNGDPRFKAYQAQYKKYCAPDKSAPALSAEDRARGCLVASLYYRSAIVDLMTEDQPLANISDVRVLTDKLFAQFESNMPNSVKIAERLLEVDPQNYAAAEMSVMAQLYQAELGKAGPGDARWEAAEKSLEKVKELLPDAPQTHELDIFLTLKKTGDPELVRTKALALDKKFPKLHMGPYYEAWAEYKLGNDKTAERLLGEAKKRAPQNPNVQKAPPFSAPFATSMEAEYGAGSP